mgnify:CR=1 FL=1
MWVARDDYGLWLFLNEPVKTIINGDKYFIKRDNIRYSIDSNLFPEITFENSPRKVKFELVEKDLLEKACEWLSETLYIHTEITEDKHWNETKTFDWVTSDYNSVEEFIEAFKKAMKNV